MRIGERFAKGYTACFFRDKRGSSCRAMGVIFIGKMHVAKGVKEDEKKMKIVSVIQNIVYSQQSVNHNILSNY